MRAALSTVVLVFIGSLAHAQESVRVTQDPERNDRLRWELIADGASNLADSNPAGSDDTVPNLSKPGANFLFRLDFQPLLNYLPVAGQAGRVARRSLHARVDIGVTSAPRAVAAKPDPASSDAVDTLIAQGATVTGETEAAPTLTRQRAFTVGGEYSHNLLVGAEGRGVFSEVGGVVRGNFDTFLEDERFFEKGGLTYMKVPSPLGSDGSYYRFESGFRYRLSNGEMRFQATNEGANVDDLLLFEAVYRYSGATRGLVPDGNAEHRFLWRFVATPRLDRRDDTERNTMKALIGIEVDRDLKGKGASDVRIFYGTNVNLEALFK